MVINKSKSHEEFFNEISGQHNKERPPGEKNMQKPIHQSLREIQRQEREDLILQVAREVFLEKGYHESSIDEIAARVGVAKGTIYLHFASKEALVIAIIKKRMEAFVQEVEQVAAKKKSVMARLEELFYYVSTGLFSDDTRFFSTLLSGMDMKHLLEEEESKTRPVIERLIKRISELLEEGKASGELDNSIPTSILTSTFFQLLSPRNYEKLIAHHDLPAEKVASYLTRIYLTGITANK
jgi:TetR/AcrR family transcriptional regulator, fatty acid metabolism regulator protein